MAESLVLDASAMVDLLVGSDHASSIEARLHDSQVPAPGHFDAEVLSALGRLHRASQLTKASDRARQPRRIVTDRPASPCTAADGAWRRRGSLRLVDALYVELASQLDTLIVTTDRGLASGSRRATLIERGP